MAVSESDVSEFSDNCKSQYMQNDINKTKVVLYPWHRPLTLDVTSYETRELQCAVFSTNLLISSFNQ
jgi:hypothetical protein